MLTLFLNLLKEKLRQRLQELLLTGPCIFNIYTRNNITKQKMSPAFFSAAKVWDIDYDMIKASQLWEAFLCDKRMSLTHVYLLKKILDNFFFL